MKKKLLFVTLFIITVLLISATFNTSYATMNEIRNFMGGAENTIENMAGGAGNMIRSGTNTMSDTMNNFVNGDQMQMQNDIEGAMTMDNTTMNNTAATTGDYTATRTAVTADNVTVAGISVNVWTWIVIALAVVGIGVLIWSYAMQKNRHSNSYYDE